MLGALAHAHKHTLCVLGEDQRDLVLVGSTKVLLLFNSEENNKILRLLNSASSLEKKLLCGVWKHRQDFQGTQ